MSNVTTITNPLMQPIQYNGQTYFTGQYFHQMYRNNSDTGGKYKQASHFLRLVRSIAAYPKYIEAGDIVELTKDRADPDYGSVFKANYGNPIMLINATAQVALTHHLDDEVSKSASVKSNRQTAAGQKSITAFQQAKAAPALLSAYLEAGKLLGTSEAMAKAVAVEQVRSKLGVDFEPMLIGNTVEEKPETPTALGQEIGISGRAMNKALTEAGLQKKVGDEWVPTHKADGYYSLEPYQSRDSDHTGYRALWYKSVLDVITADEVTA